MLSLGRQLSLAVKQLRNELTRQHSPTLARDTIHQVLVKHGKQVLKRPPRWRKGSCAAAGRYQAIASRLIALGISSPGGFSSM